MPADEVTRDKYLQRKYGITLEQYGLVLAFQGGVCAVCQAPPPKSGRSLHVDHDHKTGFVRGVLCWTCNNFVIERRTADKLEAGAAYLRNPPAFAVIGKVAAPKPKPRKRKAKK